MVALVQESLVCTLLDLAIDDGNIEDSTDFDIQTKLQELSSCTDEDIFQNVLNEFPEKYKLGVTTPFLHLSADKDTVIKNIIYHCSISSCLEEIRSVQTGMSILSVSIVLFFFQFLFFFSYQDLNHNNGYMVTCFFFSSLFYS